MTGSDCRSVPLCCGGAKDQQQNQQDGSMRSAIAVTTKPLIDNDGLWPDVVITSKGKSMNWDQVEGKWKEMTGSIKAKWGDLTSKMLVSTHA